jgi:hypothetical protein
MIEVLVARGAVIVTVAPISRLAAVQGVGIRLAGFGIDRQPDRKPAALLDSVQCGYSGIRSSLALFLLEPVPANSGFRVPGSFAHCRKHSLSPSSEQFFVNRLAA